MAHYYLLVLIPLEAEKTASDKNTPLLCVLGGALVLALGVGIGYYLRKRGNFKPISQQHTRNTTKNQASNDVTMISKADALQVMELMKCLHEIDQIK